MRASPKAPLSSRLWPRIDTSETSGLTDAAGDPCWPWTGAKNKDGYGLLKFKGVVLYVHRLVFALSHNGHIPAGHFVMHSCDHPICCKPAHLSNGTCGENTQAAYDRGLNPRKKQAKKGTRNRQRWGGEPLELQL